MLGTMDWPYKDNSQFDPRKYDSHLSLFGRKVLDNLLKNKTAEKYRTYQSRMPPPTSHWPQTKKVITSLSEPRPPQLFQPPPITILDTHTIDDKDESNDNPLDFNPIEKYAPEAPPVPSTKDLLKTFETNKGREDYNLSNRKILVESKGENHIQGFYEKLQDSDGEYFRNNAGKGKAVPVVNWDDMFDCDLLPEVATIPQLMIQQNDTRTVEDSILNINTSKEKENNSTPKDEKLNNANKCKRKTNQYKVTDAIPKKIKKINEREKASLRKQKYTKTVKNWLNDVDPNNLVVELEATNSDNVDDKNHDTTSNKSKYINIKKELNKTEGIIIEKIKQKPNKKVVQTQLANKDGIMKFDKPKQAPEIEIPTMKPGNTETDKTKDKKTKLKFVAPIKSQVPVKEKDYKVVSVDDTNIQYHTNRLCGIENSEMIIVLVFSNGFSQLNMHYTEDSCISEGFMVNINEDYYYFKGVHQSFKEVITAILERNIVICYEGKSILIYFKSKFNMEFTNLNMVDAKIGGSLLDPDNLPENFTDCQKLLSYTPEYTIATECPLQKTAWYLTLLDKCAVRLTTLLKENDLWSVFVDIEMKLLPIVAEMEHRGVTVNIEKLRSMEDILLSKMKEVERQCHKAAGKTFQITSAVQIRSILYDELQLDTKCNIKIKETTCKGAKSTSETMLRSLVSVHPLPKLILEYRHLHKAHATFLTGIAQHVKDGVVRPTWVQMAAATGRIASNNPNLQAIPKVPFSLILFPDENNSGNQSLSIRSIYTSREGWSLLAADFQHVECRVFAHCAADGALADALQAGGDLFRTLAARWLNKPESEISSEDRERTKRIVYASLYGAGSAKLMEILRVSYEQTLSIIASFNRTFPSLKSFGRSVVSRCEQNAGRLSTLCGRARHFKNISSQDFQLKSQAERQAVNFIVQGSAADLCKLAMVACCAGLRARRLRGRLLLQIHDELVWELADEHVHAAAEIIKEVMEGCGRRCGLSIALPVSLSVGKTWGDMTEYTTPDKLNQ